MANLRLKLRNHGWMAALLLLVGLTTLSSLHHPFVFDDLHRVVNNPDLRHWDADLLHRLLYPYGPVKALERNDPSRPLVALVHTAIYHWYQLDPAVYRACNIILHLINVVLVASWGALLITNAGTRKTETQLPFAAAISGAALFGLAPLNIGTVIYIYGLSDVLTTTFTLAALILMTTSRPPTLTRHILAVCATLLALLAKQSAAVIPMLAACTRFTLVPPDKETLWHRCRLSLRATWPLWLLVFAYLSWRFFYLGELGDIEGDSLRKGAWDYIRVEPWALLRYLQFALVPWGFSLDHDPAVPGAAVTALSVALLGGATIWSLRVIVRVGTQPTRMVAFAWLFGLIALAPTSSFIPTVDYLVERRAYLPSAAWLMAAGVLLWHCPRWTKMVAIGGLALWFSLDLPVARQRIARYASERTLWEEVLSIYPDSSRAHANLGAICFEQHDLAGAKSHFEASLKDNPDAFISLYNLGTIHMMETSPFYNPATARKDLREALRIRPDFAAALLSLARLSEKEGDRPAAEDSYRRAIALRHDLAAPHQELGALLLNTGRFVEAKSELREALRLIDIHDAPPSAGDPLSARRLAMLDLALASRLAGQAEEAAALYQDLLRERPDDAIAMSRLAILLAEKTSALYDPARASALFTHSLDLKPDDPDALEGLARLRADQGQTAQAELLRGRILLLPKRK